MMALSATSRDGVSLQGLRGLGAMPSLVGPPMPNLVGIMGTSLMGLGADGTVDPAATAVPTSAMGVGLLGLVVGAAVTAGITSWMFAASRDGSNLKPGLVAGGTYLGGGLLLLGLASMAR